jgi:hypothetical protein
VIGDNETGFDGNSDSTYRKEGWEFILAGGGLYNNLDYSFTVGHEDGSFNYPTTQPGGGSTRLRQQLGYLHKFIGRFEFVRMKPDSTIASTGNVNEQPYVLTEPGKQYAIYIFKGSKKEISLELPAGDYEVEWLDPLTGKFSNKQQLKHEGSKVTLTSPEYKEDAALSIVKKRN